LRPILDSVTTLRRVPLRTAHRLLSLGARLVASAALGQISCSTLTGTVMDASTRAPVPDVVGTDF